MLTRHDLRLIVSDLGRWRLPRSHLSTVPSGQRDPSTINDAPEKRLIPIHPQLVDGDVLGGCYPAGWPAGGQWIYAWDFGPSSTIKVPTGSGREVETLFEWPFEGDPLALGSPCAPVSDTDQWICNVIEASTDVWLIDNFDTTGS